MEQLSVKVTDEMYEWLRRRVTADVTISSQVNEALEEYRKHGTRKQREAEQVVEAQHG